MGDMGGVMFDLLKKTIGIANVHYPERSHVIFMVNAPFFFSMLWKVVKPMVHPNTQKKVRILSRAETLSGLQEHIDLSQIPEYYGGQLDYGGHDSCRYLLLKTHDNTCNEFNIYASICTQIKQSRNSCNESIRERS